MAPSDIERLRQQLLEMKTALMASNAKTTDAIELDQSRMGRLSRMDAMQDQQIAMETKRRGERKLLAVEGALRRIESEDFGYCFICDNEIPMERLEFDPTVTRCIGCVSS